MKITESKKKAFRSKLLWCNLLAMTIVAIASVVATKLFLDHYTHHGEVIVVPDVVNMSSFEARKSLKSVGLQVEVADTGYVKDLPADCILEQKPVAGERVKAEHVISLTVNSSRTPTLAMPDIVQNCSLREAMAKLKAMGFKVGEPQYVSGEKDWVYGVTVNGYHVAAGERVSVNSVVTVQVGSGRLSLDDYVDLDDALEEDDFEIID